MPTHLPKRPRVRTKKSKHFRNSASCEKQIPKSGSPSHPACVTAQNPLPTNRPPLMFGARGMDKSDKSPKLHRQPSAAAAFLQLFPKNSDTIHLLSIQELKARQPNESRVFEFKKGSQKPQKLPLKLKFFLDSPTPFPRGRRRNSDTSQHGITPLTNHTQDNPIIYSSSPSVFPLPPGFCIIPRVWRFRNRRSGVPPLVEDC